MTSFKLTPKRLAALDSAIDAIGAADAAERNFADGVSAMYAAGFRGAHLASRGKGGAGEPGAAFDAVMDRGAARLFSEEELAIWNGPKGPKLSELKRRAANYVLRVKTKLEALEADKASKGKGKASGKGKGARAGASKSAVEVDKDTIAKRISVIQNALKADTTARKENLAAYGGEAEAKTLLAAWDTLRATYK